MRSVSESAGPRRTSRASAQPGFSFSGHETFVFRYGWLTKAVTAVTEDPGVFAREDAIVRLGVGKNMVRSIRPGLWQPVSYRRSPKSGLPDVRLRIRSVPSECLRSRSIP